MSKRTVHMEVDDRTCVDTDGINRGLAGLASQAEDSYDFEDILTKAMQALYQLQPEGQANYSGDDPRVGKVWLCRFNNHQCPGNANIEYTPSPQYHNRFRYIQKGIGTINLREKTYYVGWGGDRGEDFYQIPNALMRDTPKVMECLGLTRKT